VQPFQLPPPQPDLAVSSKRFYPKEIDNGVRDVPVVTFSGFSKSEQSSLEKNIANNLPEDNLEKLCKGQFVVINMTPKTSPWYTLNFVLAEIIEDVSLLDTTKASTSFTVQVYRPATASRLDSKFIKWIGDDNLLWKPRIERRLIKAIVNVIVRGGKLDAKFLKLINNIHF